MTDVKKEVKKIIKESASINEVWARVEEELGDLGTSYLFKMGFPGPDEETEDWK